jgi:PAS domain S-box-containing protein
MIQESVAEHAPSDGGAGCTLEHDRFRRFVDHAADAFFLHDLDGRFVDVNRRACESLGYTRDELLRMSVADVELDIDEEALARAWRGLDLGVPMTFTGHHRRRDGSAFPVELRVTRVTVGGDPHVLALARDMSAHEQVERELRRAKEAAESADRAKSEFLTNISHDIRTPINAVLGMADLLEATSLSETQREYLRTIRNGGETLLRLIEQVLQYARVGMQQPLVQQVRFDLAELIENVVDLLAASAHEKGIELVSAVDQPAQKVIGDPERLRQVLLNLCGNAVKFTDHGEVLVCARASAGGLALAVRDSGIGIPEPVQHKVFEPFEQCQVDAERRGGVGLGLPISKRLVEEMGGSIAFTSRAGVGSTFRVRLPFPGTGAPARVSPATLSGHSVFVCVANRLLSTSLVAQLRSLGMEAHALSEAGAQEVLSCDCLLVETGSGRPDWGALNAWRARLRPDAYLLVLEPLDGILSEVLPARIARARVLRKPLRPGALRNVLCELFAPPAPAGAEAPQRQPVRGRVLVADDDETSRRVLLYMLSGLGYEAEGVESGEAVLASVHSGRYNLVLMDCQMRGMDGYHAAAELRRREGGDQHLPIIAVTANATPENERQCLHVGMDAYLTKPVRIDRLAAVLGQWMGSAGVGQAGEASRPDREAVGALPEEPSPSPFPPDLIDVFLTDARTRVTRLQRAALTGEYEEITREAHALVGSARYVGADHLADLSRRVESCARDGCGEAIPPLVDELDTEVVRVALNLRARFRGQRTAGVGHTVATIPGKEQDGIGARGFRD